MARHIAWHIENLENQNNQIASPGNNGNERAWNGKANPQIYVTKLVLESSEHNNLVKYGRVRHPIHSKRLTKKDGALNFEFIPYPEMLRIIIIVIIRNNSKTIK